MTLKVCLNFAILQHIDKDWLLLKSSLFTTNHTASFSQGLFFLPDMRLRISRTIKNMDTPKIRNYKVSQEAQIIKDDRLKRCFRHSVPTPCMQYTTGWKNKQATAFNSP